MIETLWITNPSGETLELNLRSSEETHGLLVFNFEGLGSPKATVNAQSGYNYHGTTNPRPKADARHIILTLAITAKGAAEETARKKVYDYFPVNEEIKFRAETDGTKDVYAMGIVESVEMNISAKVENAVISIYCADPFMIDNDLSETVMLLDTPTNIPYSGNVPTGFYTTIFLGGLTSNITIENDNGPQSMTIAITSALGAAPDVGSKIYLDTRFAQKSIIYESRLGVQTDITHSVDLADDWIELRHGDNNIEVTATTVTTETDYPSPTNLGAYYPLNETDGGDAIDLHASLDLTRYNTVGYGDGYVYDAARQFNVEDSPYFRGPANSVNAIFGLDHTVIFWANPDTYTNRVVISRKKTTYQKEGYEIAFTSSTNLRVTQWHLDTSYITNFTVSGSGWRMFSIQWDYSLLQIKIAQNGGTPTSNSPVQSPSSGTEKFYLGAVDSGGDVASNFYDGRLQSLIIYEQLLTDAEIDWFYASNGRTYVELIADIETTIQFNTKFSGV